MKTLVVTQSCPHCRIGTLQYERTELMCYRVFCVNCAAQVEVNEETNRMIVSVPRAREERREPVLNRRARRLARLQAGDEFGEAV